jgi:hypothetical protein
MAPSAPVPPKASWLLLAQQTAWVEYATINPRGQELLLATVRKVLACRSDKNSLVDSIFGEDKKNKGDLSQLASCPFVSWAAARLRSIAARSMNAILRAASTMLIS